MKSLNKHISLVLVCGIAGCIALLPWSRWFATKVDPDAALTVRMAEYVKARKQDDGVALYSLMCERDRKAATLARFLSFCQGHLKTIEMTEKARRIDVPHGVAVVDFVLDAELQVDKLPPQMRRSLKYDDPSQLRKSEDFRTEWEWDNGTWWLRMDPAISTGRAADGREVKPGG